MTEPTTHGPGHEQRDISAPVVAWFALGTVVLIVLSGLVVAWLFHLFGHQHPSPEPTSRIAADAQMIAPPPRLQINPASDLKRFQASEELELNSYGWVDKEAGVIRIPIQRAIDLVAQRGLPTRQPGSHDASGKTPVDMQKEKARPSRTGGYPSQSSLRGGALNFAKKGATDVFL